MRSLLCLLIIVLLLIPVSASYAQDPGTNQDNACYTGGTLAGKCSTPWHWICGWYLTRWESAGGWFGTYQLPTTCASLLPPRPASLSGADAAGTDGVGGAGTCYTNGKQSILYSGTPNTSAAQYNSTNCSGPAIPDFLAVVTDFPNCMTFTGSPSLFDVTDYGLAGLAGCVKMPA